MFSSHTSVRNNIRRTAEDRKERVYNVGGLVKPAGGVRTLLWADQKSFGGCKKALDT
jgi:hypothetical protein